MIARVQKAGSGVETFSLRTQDAWQYEFDTLIQGNAMLQGTRNYAMSRNIKNVWICLGSCVFLISDSLKCRLSTDVSYFPIYPPPTRCVRSHITRFLCHAESIFSLYFRSLCIFDLLRKAPWFHISKQTSFVFDWIKKCILINCSFFIALTSNSVGVHGPGYTMPKCLGLLELTKLVCLFRGNYLELVYLDNFSTTANANVMCGSCQCN